MRIAVYGAGGIGGYFGGRLAEAGEDVVFIARGAHLQAIQRGGLRVESVAGNFEIRAARAVENAAEARPVDAVLVCVKAWDVPAAAAAISKLLGPETFVVPLENGIEAPDQLSAEIGADRVVPGLCRIVSYIASPGVIRHAASQPSIEFGEADGRRSARVEALRVAFERCRGVTVRIPSDIRAALWEKFLFISAFSSVAAACRLPVGGFREVPETRSLLVAAMGEVAALARQRGVALDAACVAKNLRFIDGLAPESTASMQRDIQEGRPSELENQAGAVVRLSREAGLECPAFEFLHAVLAPQERRARKIDS
jgi:2-dehydropantoate 2-reductase